MLPSPSSEVTYIVTLERDVRDNCAQIKCVTIMRVNLYSADYAL